MMACLLFAFAPSCSCRGNVQTPPPEETVPPSAVYPDPEDPGINFDKKIGDIIRGSASGYSIVYAASKSETQYYAATELQTFLEQVAGAILPLEPDDTVKYKPEGKYISVGGTSLLSQAGITFDYDSLNGDGFFIKSLDNSLFINGANDRGVLYGVYDYLEIMTGLRFLAFDRTYIPELNKLELFETDRVQIPAFEYRGMLTPPTQGNEAFTARMRMTHEFANLSSMYGRNIGWFTGAGANRAHTALYYVNPDTYFSVNPAMFAYASDKTPYVKQNIIDVCLSNGITADGKIDETMSVSTIKAAVQSLIKFIGQSDEHDEFFMFGQEDGGEGCSCGACKANELKYKRSGMAVRFANILADEAQKWADANANGRKINIVTFAYLYSQTGPTDDRYVLLDPQCKPRDNVYIRMAPIFLDFNRSYTDPKQHAETREALKSWESVHDKFMVWSYHTDFGDYLHYLSTMHTWHDTLTYLKDLGVRYMFMQNQFHDETQFQANLDCYVASKMLWNPRASAVEIKDEYIRLYYGAAAPYVKQYVDDFDTHIHLAMEYDGYFFEYFSSVFNNSPVHHEPRFFPINFLQKQVAVLDAGIAAVENDAALSASEKNALIKRIKAVRIVPKNMILKNYAFYFDNADIERYYYAVDFFNDCAEIGITHYREGQTIDVLKKQYLG